MSDMSEKDWNKAERKMAKRQARAEQALKDVIGTTAAKLMAITEVRRLTEVRLPTLDAAIVDAQFMLMVSTQTAAELEALSDAADDAAGSFEINGVPVVAEWTSNPKTNNTKENES